MRGHKETKQGEVKISKQKQLGILIGKDREN